MQIKRRTPQGAWIKRQLKEIDKMEHIYLKVWGNYACFTRPEMKVERVTYDVMTPSAARGILEAIYWKPAMRYIIDEISVLKPMKFLTIRRNEVNNKMAVSFASIKKAIDSGEAIGLDTTDSRTQRLSMVLKDVCYIIKAHVELTGKCDEEEKQQAEDTYCQVQKHAFHEDSLTDQGHKDLDSGMSLVT